MIGLFIRNWIFIMIYFDPIKFILYTFSFNKLTKKIITSILFHHQINNPSSNEHLSNPIQQQQSYISPITSHSLSIIPKRPQQRLFHAKTTKAWLPTQKAQNRRLARLPTVRKRRVVLARCCSTADTVSARLCVRGAVRVARLCAAEHVTRRHTTVQHALPTLRCCSMGARAVLVLHFVYHAYAVFFRIFIVFFWHFLMTCAFLKIFYGNNMWCSWFFSCRNSVNKNMIFSSKYIMHGLIFFFII